MSKANNEQVKKKNLCFPVEKNYEAIEQDIKCLTGKILTIIDGAITHEKQNKAIKDQIKNEISSLLSSYQSQCSEGKAGHSVLLDN